MSEKKTLLALETSEKRLPSPMAKAQREQKQMIYKRRRLTVMFVLAFGLFTFMGINLFRNGQHLLSLQQNHTEVKKEYAKVKTEKKDLENEVKLLKDPEYVEKVARAKYFYSKEGEQVYSIPGLSGAN
ncbi:MULTISPECIES: septum formation initiator family protein [unclassified Vagococcus]|uniref:FtsB family cell division protein n=1 Tax=unclassified Vagococcus TaxID=2648499 RepID=UPI001F5063F0|nr:MULTISPECIES: septum formation initiator family protein [unclassified Vagococcus]MCI0131394.1 septum formation initiator family protein [Vagococcus sp. CY53-2]UNM89619.1 septum formation initiator family protein [Vagococcus sp. CY52-2]